MYYKLNEEMINRKYTIKLCSIEEKDIIDFLRVSATTKIEKIIITKEDVKHFLNYIDKLQKENDELQKELKDSINARFELQRRIDKIQKELEQKKGIEMMTNEEKETIEHIKESPTYREIMLLRIIDKLQKENEELQKCLEAEEKYSKGLNRDIKSLLNIEPNTNFISKDKIKTKLEQAKEVLENLDNEQDIIVQKIVINYLEELLGETKDEE